MALDPYSEEMNMHLFMEGEYWLNVAELNRPSGRTKHCLLRPWAPILCKHEDWDGLSYGMIFRFLLAFACLVPSTCFPDTLLGRVVAVSDGDTITVLDASNEQHKIRISGIDAPEKKQAFGERSKQSMARMVFGRPVQVDWKKADRYGRLIGKVLVPQENCRGDACPKNMDAGLAQIAAGLAWHYKTYEREQEPADRFVYAESEIMAQAKKIGLWSDPLPIAPWDFRRKK